MKKQIIDFYLEYLNNFLTIDRLAEYFSMEPGEASALVDLGRKYHEENVAWIKLGHPGITCESDRLKTKVAELSNRVTDLSFQNAELIEALKFVILNSTPDGPDQTEADKEEVLRQINMRVESALR